MESHRVRGDGFVYQRGATWWVGHYESGKLIRESAKTSDRDQALKVLRRCTKAAAKAEAQNVPYLTSKDRKRTVSDLIAALQKDFELRGKASAQNFSNLRRVDTDFGMHRAIALTRDKVDSYITQRLADGDAPASINRVTQLLGQAYEFAEMPAPRIRHLSEKGNERKGFFSPAEIERVIQNLPDYLQPFTRFGWLTGMRKGEIGSLEWSDVDGDVIVLKGEDSKNEEARTIPIEGEIGEVLEVCRKAREICRSGKVVSISRLLFHTAEGEPILEFRKSWARACSKAGVGQMVCPKCELAVDKKHHCPKCGTDWRYDQLTYVGRIFHDLRRSAVRNMTKAGVQRHVAMSLSGHKTESMFERYNISDVTDQREAIRKTQQYVKTVRENVAVMAAGK